MYSFDDLYLLQMDSTIRENLDFNNHLHGNECNHQAQTEVKFDLWHYFVLLHGHC